MSDVRVEAEPLDETVAQVSLGHLAEESRLCSEGHDRFASVRANALTAFYGKVLRETLHMRAQAYKARVKAETAAIIAELEGEANGGEQPEHAGEARGPSDAGQPVA